MLKCVIFDCDGVLFDSLSANIAFYNDVLGQLGCAPMTEEMTRLSHRLSTGQFFDHIFSQAPRLREESRRLAQQTDYEPFYRLMQPAAGLREVLGSLAGNFRLAMATNRGFTAHEVVRRFQLSPPLELTVGVRDVARPKPAPDMLLRCLEHFALAPEEAVYVGDMPSDFEAATAAGMRFVGLGEVRGAPRRVARLADLVPILGDGTW